MSSLARSAASDSDFQNALVSIFKTRPNPEVIDKWLRDSFVYQPESFEIVRTPGWMIQEWYRRGWFSGDCDDVSTMAAAILASYNYDAKFIAIRYSDPSEFQHVFVETDGFIIDPTVRPGTQYVELERMTEIV